MLTLRDYVNALREVRDGETSAVVTWIGDSHHAGISVLWRDSRWWLIDHETPGLRVVKTLLVVSPPSSVDPEQGLNQACLACDLDSPRGVWILDGDDPHFSAPPEWDPVSVLAMRNEPCSLCGEDTDFERSSTRADWYLCKKCEGTPKAEARGFAHNR